MRTDKIIWESLSQTKILRFSCDNIIYTYQLISYISLLNITNICSVLSGVIGVSIYNDDTCTILQCLHSAVLSRRSEDLTYLNVISTFNVKSSYLPYTNTPCINIRVLSTMARENWDLRVLNMYLLYNYTYYTYVYINILLR